jgi:hypothetical protein
MNDTLRPAATKTNTQRRIIRAIIEMTSPTDRMLNFRNERTWQEVPPFILTSLFDTMA